MALFSTDFLSLCYSNLPAAKEWWIKSFECRQERVPQDWDCPLPSDIALKLPGDVEPSILLSDSAEVRTSGYESANEHTILFCRNLAKARQYLQSRGVIAGPTQDGGGTEFFEIRDLEGNVIEICKEP